MDFGYCSGSAKKRASLLFGVLILDQPEQAPQEGKHRAGLYFSGLVHIRRNGVSNASVWLWGVMETDAPPTHTAVCDLR